MVSLPQPPHTREINKITCLLHLKTHFIHAIHTFELPGTHGAMQSVVVVVSCKELPVTVDTLDSGDCAVAGGR